MPALRIGFIGAGGIAVGHYQRLHATRKARVVALTDPSKKSLNAFYKRCPGSENLPVYRDYEKMIAEETLDGVVIQSPHAFHYDQITYCLKKGVHVLTEKPMVCTITHAKTLIKLAKTAKPVLMLSYQRHYDPAFRYMRDQIAKGRLGKITFVQAIQSQEWLRLTTGTWRQKHALSCGGQLNDSGSHLIDIMMWVTGLQVRSVFATSENYGKEVDIDSTLSMQFKNGALGSMAIIGNAPTWHEDHTIVGTKGAFYLREGQPLLQQDALGRQIKIKLPKYNNNPDKNFIDVILGKDTPQTPPECGLRTIELTEAAWRSAKLRKPVALK